ncbi:hypothetical protein [Paraburkholderia phosphatilytica]|uniref:hypothetical protein n=1 Tax=Paraburkholderia phosphatilytica TaxID=2282883 RepID=UPI000E526935|nr:hypothetical protein [Paraburkholderia phosphatilytica]
MKAIKFAVPLTLALLAAHPAWSETELAKTAAVALENAQPVHLKAQIVGIDAPSRTLTLRNADGEFVDVVVSQKVTRFNELKVGEQVDVLYKDALLVAAGKPSAAHADLRERVDSTVRVPTADGFDTVREVEVLATVQKIDHEKRLVTLRGPYRTLTLKIGQHVDLKDAKVGDEVHAVFIAAAAVEVSPLGHTAQ